MPLFKYTGRNTHGDRVNGEVDAGSLDAAANQLISIGVSPIDILQLDEGVSEFWLALQERLLKPRVKLDELMILCRQLYSLLKAGVPLNRVMQGLAGTCKNPALAEALQDVEQCMNAGIDMASAFSKHPKIFSRLFVNLVHVGENTGHLDQSFLQLAQYLQLELDTRKRIAGATRYPLFVMIAIAIAMLVVNIFVIPVFANMFEKFNADLPWATELLLGVSSFFVSYWPLLLGALVFLGTFVRRFVATPVGAYWWGRNKLRIPVVGSIVERAMLGRFTRTFGMMLQAGVPLTTAMELCAQTADNAYFESRIRMMRDGIERGDTLLRIATQSDLFSPLILQMMGVGEETGQMDDLLLEVAMHYENEVDYELKSLSGKIEPILISFIAALVAVLALGIFLPMWDMFSVTQGG